MGFRDGVQASVQAHLTAGVKAHLMSQVEEEKPDQLEELESEISVLANMVADAAADAAAMELVQASQKLAKMYESIKFGEYLCIFEDAKGRIRSTVKKLDPEMSESDDAEDDEDICF